MSRSGRGRPSPLGDDVRAILRSLGVRDDLGASLPERIAPQEGPPKISEEERMDAKLELLKSLGWPLRALRCAVDADETCEGVVEVARWKLADPNVIVLSGPKGAGKTVAAAWWALRRPYRTTFVRAATVLRMSRFGDEWRDVLAAEALCLDDLGVEYMDDKGSFLSDLDELVDTFYGDLRPLIITTNATMFEFAERVGERIGDRLVECGRWSNVRGSSMRGPR